MNDLVTSSNQKKVQMRRNELVSLLQQPRSAAQSQSQPNQDKKKYPFKN